MASKKCFYFRMGIALGEGACRPASGSLIAEFFGPENRAKVCITYFQEFPNCGLPFQYFYKEVRNFSRLTLIYHKSYTLCFIQIFMQKFDNFILIFNFTNFYKRPLHFIYCFYFRRMVFFPGVFTTDMV